MVGNLFALKLDIALTLIFGARCVLLLQGLELRLKTHLRRRRHFVLVSTVFVSQVLEISLYYLFRAPAYLGRQSVLKTGHLLSDLKPLSPLFYFFSVLVLEAL